MMLKKRTTSRHQHRSRHSSIFRETFCRQTFHQMQVSAKVRPQTFLDLSSKSTTAIVGLCNRQVSKKVAAKYFKHFNGQLFGVSFLNIFHLVLSCSPFQYIHSSSSKYSFEIFLIILDYVLFLPNLCRTQLFKKRDM